MLFNVEIAFKNLLKKKDRKKNNLIYLVNISIRKIEIMILYFLKEAYICFSFNFDLINSNNIEKSRRYM